MRNLKSIIFGLILSLATGFAWAEPIDINKATADKLAVNIKGVGKKKAEAIIAYRQANGPFKTIEEIVKVKGIGQKILEKNRQNLLISQN